MFVNSDTSALLDDIRHALDSVQDPEIHRPITELGMVKDLTVDDQGVVSLTVLLTVAGCPLKNTIEADVQQAIRSVDGVSDVILTMSAMSDEQRAELATRLRGGQPAPVIPFAQPGNLTHVISIASGKGGVGKSSITVNLALALAAQGKKVGLLDADIYGHSVPDLLGMSDDDRPTMVDSMIMPVPVSFEKADGTKVTLKVISMGMLKESRDQVIAWRGPILDRALTQLLSEVFWGDLDVFLIDLPPGTGDVAMSIGQKLPGSDMIVVTTPQPNVAWVAERAGTMGSMMNQRVIGVVENMSWLERPCPNCSAHHRIELFGSGGGKQTAQGLSERLGTSVELLAQIPMDEAMSCESVDQPPVVIAHPDHPCAQAINALAQRLIASRPSLAGQSLNLTTH